MRGGLLRGALVPRCHGILAVLALLAAVCFAAEKGDKAKAGDDRKAPAEPSTSAKDRPAEEKGRGTAEKAATDFTKEIEAEAEARAVPLPPEMELDLEWYSPRLDASSFGKIVKGWVGEDLVLLETDKHSLFCVRRSDGVETWVCSLTDSIRYSPSVTRNNVVVNVNNNLVGIQRESGFVRWRLQPNFVMSCAPLVVDPPAYPKQYTKEWKNLETVYVGGWDGRFYCMFVRGRMTLFVRHIIETDNFSAPEFDLYDAWHKTHKERGIISTNIVLKDNILYYAADDHNVYAVTREALEREPYYALGVPCTGVTVTASSAANVANSLLSSLYFGAHDNYVYCLDRLTLKKKWAYASGYTPCGNITADETATPMAYVACTDGELHALQLQPARSSKGQPETPESFSHAWSVKGGTGVVTTGPDVVYVGWDRDAALNSYKGVMAVEKATGKVLWQSPKSEFFQQFLEFQNSWDNPKLAARVYTITADNRLVSLRERVRKTGLIVVKAPEPEPEAPKMIGKKSPKSAATEGAAPAAEPGKEAAPKKEEEKKEEKPAEKREAPPAEKKDEKPAEKKLDAPAEKKDEKPAEKKPDAPAEKKDEKPAEKKPDAPAEKKDEKPAEK